MPRIQLTKARVESLRAGATIWDAEVRGFGARRRTAEGAPVFVLKYWANGRQRFATIGPHGSPWTCDSARNEARRLLGEVAKGLDVAGDRAKSKAAPTVAELGNDFFERHAQTKLKPGTVANYELQLRLYVVPAFGAMKVEAVQQRDVAKLHHSMRGEPYSANRVLALVSKLFNWAAAQGYRPHGTNPALGIERYREHRRERFLSEAEVARLGETLAAMEGKATVSAAEGDQLEAAIAEVVRLVAARTRAKAKLHHSMRGEPVEALGALKAARAEVKRLRALQANGESPWTVAAIRVLLMTGARRDEIVKARWDWIDLERGLLMLPDSKTGKKVLHLSAPAALAISSVPRLVGNPFIFCGSKAGRPISDLTGRWIRIREVAGLPDVRLHDLRHSYASMAAGRGGSLVMIGALLGHMNQSTTHRYAHLAADPLRELNNRVGADIARQLGGNKDNVKSADIKQFRR